MTTLEIIFTTSFGVIGPCGTVIWFLLRERSRNKDRETERQTKLLSEQMSKMAQDLSSASKAIDLLRNDILQARMLQLEQMSGLLHRNEFEAYRKGHEEEHVAFNEKLDNLKEGNHLMAVEIATLGAGLRSQIESLSILVQEKGNE